MPHHMYFAGYIWVKKKISIVREERKEREVFCRRSKSNCVYYGLFISRFYQWHL